MSGIRAKVNLSAVTDALSNQEKQVALAVTAGMKDGTDAVKLALRAQVVQARLGQRLANTWRDQTYPSKGASSLHPKGYLWSEAPEILSAYADGADIVPINGKRYIAIPSATARAMTGRRGRRLTVAEVEAKLKREIVIIKGKSGNLLGLYDPRTATGRRKGAKRELALLYTFVPSVRVNKRFSVQDVVNETAATIPQRISERLSA